MKRLALLLSVCALVACGGGNSPGTEFSGVASKGPLTGARICAYAINGSGVKGAQIGVCANTDAAGHYKIKLGSYTGPVLFQATGGAYTDEATGTTIPLSVPLNSVLMDATSLGDSVAITPLTELAYRYASALAGGLSRANVQAGLATVQNVFGVSDIVHILPVDALHVPGSATTDQKAYALALATVSQYAYQQSGAILSNALQSMSDCLASPATQCGSGAASVGALMGTALGDFVGTHPDLAGLDGSTGGVAKFGSVTTVPGNGINGAGPVGTVYTIAGVGGTYLGGYLELTTANRHAALYITCNYGSPGDNEAFFFATDPSVTPGSVLVTVAIDGQPSESFDDLGYNLGGQDRAFSTTGSQGSWPWHGTFATTENGTVTRWDVAVTGSATGNCAARVYGGSGIAGNLVQP